MIEVEIRGKLKKDEFLKLKKFLEQNGKHIESHHRTMFLLKGYEGYNTNFTNRNRDIRLRDTDGQCEIMMKSTIIDNGKKARKEIALKLQDKNLKNAKAIVKALGYGRATKIERGKNIYEYRGIEWSLVSAPKEIYYYEAEKIATYQKEIALIHGSLEKEALNLNLAILDEEQTRQFIEFLNHEVNETVDF